MDIMPPKPLQPLTLLDSEATAKLLDIKVTTLTDWRIQGIGPAAYKIGRLVKYDLQDIMEWLRTRRTEGTARFGRRGCPEEGTAAVLELAGYGRDVEKS